MRPRAVLFDLDGTLLDTLEDIADSMNGALRSAGHPEHPLDAYRFFVGDGIKSLVVRALPPERRDEAVVSDFVAAVREEYGRRWKAKSRPYPGVPEMLDAVAGRGLPMSVLSNKPHHFTEIAVRALLPRWRFAVVQGAVPDRPLKPDPSGALDIARGLGIPPGDFLYLGDTSIDMETAARAGMFAVGVLWGFRGAEELERSGAKRLIREPGELAPLLGDASSR